MNNIIVYVDDAAHALHVLQPMLSRELAVGPTRWLIVGCAPRVTQHLSKWVTHSARDAWRRKWAVRVFGQLRPILRRSGDEVITMLADNALVAQTQSLTRIYGEARVLDARRPKSAQDMQPVKDAPTSGNGSAVRYLAILAGTALLAVD